MRRPRVQLEPELEDMAKNWSPEMRKIVAKKFRRWARQLDVSAKIISDVRCQAGLRSTSLPRLRPAKAVLN